MMRASKEKSRKGVSKATLLILLCWLVYACSYLGKVNYAANINQIIAFYKVSHSEAGLVSTLFFFAYGLGQVVNGLFCKKYNLKWMIAASIVLSAAANLTVALADDFRIIKYVWLVNGFSMSVLWPCLIRLLSETISAKDMARASVIMGTTVAVGTFAIYGLSALLVRLDFKIVFYVAAAALLIVVLLWLLLLPKFVKNAQENGQMCEKTSQKPEKSALQEQNGAGQGKSRLLCMIVILCVYGVVTNLIKDGLTTWVPSILKEQYSLDDSLSVILTLALPVVAIFGNAFAVGVHKKIPDFITQCALIFLAGGAILGGVIAGLSLGQFVITLVGFSAVCFLASSNNSLITSIFPLFMKGKLNSGRIAGILNGCCYIGSTISSYGLGAIADRFGWTAVFWTLLAACAAAVLICAVYMLVLRVKKCK